MSDARGMRQFAVVGVWLVFVATLATGSSRAASPLTPEERTAYARCLGATVAAAPPDSSLVAGTLLYPNLLPMGAGGPSLLASGRVALDVERQAAQPPHRSRPRTIGDALTAARAYRALGEYDKALGWYGEASVHDDDRRLAADIGRESLAAAVALGDSQGVARQLDAALITGDPASQADAVMLAYRYLLARNDTTALVRLDRRLDAAPLPLPPAVVFWRAFAAAQRGDWERSLAGARVLLAGPDSTRALDGRARLWLAGALPDLLLLTDQGADAADLYRQLAAGGPDALSAWSRYQLAGMDLAAGRFDAAGNALRTLCAASEPWPWRTRACSLAAVADTLSRLSGGGGNRGTVAVAGR